MINLSGHTALVCGASQGIGRSTAIKFAELGAKVIALSRNEINLVSLMNELKGNGHSYIATDLQNREELSGKISEKIKSNPIDILVCNSGGPKAGSLLTADDEEFLKSFTEHILANNLLVKLLFPGMKEKSYGRVINVISTSVKMPIENLGVSNTIRGAVANWAKTLSLELGKSGITVNNVLPGYTKTPRLEALISSASTRLSMTEMSVENEWKNRVPLGRFAESEEIANAIAFLASPSASYINGINLPVDGGRTGAL